MLTKEKALALVKKHGSVAAAARAKGITRKAINRSMGGDSVKPAPGSGKSLAEFRSAHDRSFIVPNRIRDGLRALGAGWEHEAQFARLAGVAIQELAIYREQFVDHIVVLKRDGNRRVWAGTKEIARKMREIAGHA